MSEISSAAARNDRRAMLVALSDKIAATLDSPDTHPRDIASLSKRLMEISDELKAFDAQQGTDPAVAAAPADEPFDGSDV